MDDPCMAWPFWKFGMKRDDLSTKLHDQYNTIPSSIQDPDAFHHDVFEVSRLADTADEFHRLMADRKEQRLKELNASLDLAAVEIIANPKLVGTAQWSYALQLFRTRSLDSLVRLFSSYLPDDYCSRQGYYTASSNGSSYSDRCSVRTASTNLSSLDDVDGPTFFHDDDDEKPIMTHEPLHISTSLSSAVVTDLPPSPRSMTTHSETSVSSPIDTDNDDYVLRNLTPARTLSFSGSESGRFAGRVLQSLDDEEEYTSQSEDPDSLTTSLSDLENRSTRESSVEEEQHPDYTQYPESAIEDEYDYEDEFPTTQLPFDLFDDDIMESSETPTPKPGITISTAAASSYLDSKPYSSLRSIPATSFRSSSPKIPHLRRRDASPAKTSTSSSSSMMSSRRSPEEALSRIQKPQPDAMRGARALAAKGRRRGLD
ncbi:uncharacterized protein CTRU02_210096 [Colletotrichum truncatum]|uniref:Uncharacterized protein n=1 Tax=Colletotrichum truncatum TaxID=5467 RepID=A0ACC3YUC6_COLTU|nr:uncharacterized protein CTRU02_02672 [Colletotrichum truncatum]KAF6798698.1 hypothetical protein CTRU02_02672 [Colletotrichum truncatum]